MLKSMTGFGRGDYTGELFALNVEIRSVNHRYNDITIRQPKQFACWELDIKKMIQERAKRGKIDVTITYQPGAATKNIVIDKVMLVNYYNTLKEISATLRLPSPDNVYELAKFDNIIAVEYDSVAPDVIRTALFQTIDAALTELCVLRSDEGAVIVKDVLERVATIEGYVEQIKRQFPQLIENYRQRLSQKLLEAGAAVTEERLLTEIVLFSEKIDFTEEVVRLASHFYQFRSIAGNDAEPVGRKLDFLIQEMGREVNTIASKANSAPVAHLVVEIKSELERIREQIQNVE